VRIYENLLLGCSYLPLPHLASLLIVVSIAPEICYADLTVCISQNHIRSFKWFIIYWPKSMFFLNYRNSL